MDPGLKSAEGMSAEKILEIKRHLNKPDESYLCDLFKRDSACIVLRYVSERRGKVGSVTFDVGSVTYAYYRDGGGYVLWRMFGADNKLKGHLFHICKDQEVSEDRVEYLDLLLDIWIDANGQLSILDRDEVEECATQGALSEQDLAWITRQEVEIVGNWRQIIADVNALL